MAKTSKKRRPPVRPTPGSPGRPPATIKTKSISVRVDKSTIAQIDDFIPKLQDELGPLGRSLVRDRSAALRALIERGLRCSGC